MPMKTCRRSRSFPSSCYSAGKGDSSHSQCIKDSSRWPQKLLTPAIERTLELKERCIPYRNPCQRTLENHLHRLGSTHHCARSWSPRACSFHHHRMHSSCALETSIFRRRHIRRQSDLVRDIDPLGTSLLRRTQRTSSLHCTLQDRWSPSSNRSSRCSSLACRSKTRLPPRLQLDGRTGSS